MSSGQKGDDELVNTSPSDARLKRSESLEELYNPHNREKGTCAHCQQELCLFFIAAFLLAIGVSLTVVAAVFGIRDLYILGPPMLLIGFVVFIVAGGYLLKKVKLRAKVAAAYKKEEEARKFTVITPPSHVPKQYTGMNGHPGNGDITMVSPRRRPTECELYGNNNVQKQSVPKQEVIMEDLSNYDKTVTKTDEPRVFFPNDSSEVTDKVVMDSTFTTPLTRLHNSPQKTSKDSTSDIVPKLESRNSTQVSFASEPIVIARTPEPTDQGPAVPDAASYTPISLTKVDLQEYEKYGEAGVT